MFIPDSRVANSPGYPSLYLLSHTLLALESGPFTIVKNTKNCALCHTSLLCRCMSQHDFGVAHIVTSAVLLGQQQQPL